MTKKELLEENKRLKLEVDRLKSLIYHAYRDISESLQEMGKK